MVSFLGGRGRSSPGLSAPFKEQRVAKPAFPGPSLPSPRCWVSFRGRRPQDFGGDLPRTWREGVQYQGRKQTQAWPLLFDFSPSALETWGPF